MKHELETPRLLLRPCGSEDLQRIHAMWTNDAVRRFLFDDRKLSLDEARALVDASSTAFEHRALGLWLVFPRDTGNLIGFAGFVRTEDEDPWLIYGIRSEDCGRGYATEAAGAVMRHAFESVG